MQVAVSYCPEKIFIAPIWDNKLILQDGKTLKKEHYPLVSTTVKTVSDFYFPNTNIMKSRDELEDSLNCDIDNESFKELLNVIKSTLKSLGLAESFAIATYYPYQPLLVNIVLSSRKGCRTFYHEL